MVVTFLGGGTAWRVFFLSFRHKELKNSKYKTDTPMRPQCVPGGSARGGGCPGFWGNLGIS